MWETVKPRHKSTRCYPVTQASNYSIISVIFEGTTDEIGSLTGQLGRIEGIEVKSALLKGHETKRRETQDNN